jgi:hypothetical protein
VKVHINDDGTANVTLEPGDMLSSFTCYVGAVVTYEHVPIVNGRAVLDDTERHIFDDIDVAPDAPAT